MSKLSKTGLFVLVLAMLAGVLTACDTPTTTAVPTQRVIPTLLPDPTAAPTPTRIISASYNPIIGFSTSSARVGDTVVINGSGFLPNAGIEILGAV